MSRDNTLFLDTRNEFRLGYSGNRKCLPYNTVQGFIIFFTEPKMKHTDQILIMMIFFQRKKIEQSFSCSSSTSCSDERSARLNHCIVAHVIAQPQIYFS